MPPKNSSHIQIQLEFEHQNALLEVCGHADENLRQIEQKLTVELVSRGSFLAIMAEEAAAEKAKIVLEDLYAIACGGEGLSQHDITAALRVVTQQNTAENQAKRPADILQNGRQIKTPLMKITPRSVQQQAYLDALQRYDLTFGLGAAGTGKTFLATAVAVQGLLNKTYKKVILTRPVVEAGERLGFLPGTLEEKIDPYLRPFFDAFEDMVGAEKLAEWREKNIVELAPLAYMRGRTLENCLMILDEAQNTTTTQMRLFLTRMGQGSKAIVTGDLTQSDLPKPQTSGLQEAANTLQPIEGIAFVRFSDADVVRHNLVGKIVKAYEEKDCKV